MEHTIQAGPFSPITCPDCHGTMQEIKDGLVRYRCHTGHAYTLESLGAIQAQAWERALYGAYRATGAIMVVRRMAEQGRREGGSGAERLEREATRRVPTCSGG